MVVENKFSDRCVVLYYIEFKNVFFCLQLYYKQKMNIVVDDDYYYEDYKD